MSSETPSRILDNDSLTVDLPEPNDHVCDFRIVYAQHLPDQPTVVARKGRHTNDCGKTATHQLITTCCNGRVTYRCDDHAVPFAENVTGSICRDCGHRCPKGVCYHRVILPL